MKSIILLMVTLVAIVGGQRNPLVPLAGPVDEYAASLGGVPVGIFGKSTDYLGGTEVHGASLAGAKIGISGRDAQRVPKVLPPRLPLPFPRKIVDPYYPQYPQYPQYRPYLPYRPPFVPPYRPYLPYRPPFVPPYLSSTGLAAARAFADGRAQRASAGAVGLGRTGTYY